MGRRCDRNRKRSKRRAIYCPHHGCYLDSVSQKYPIYADRPEHLQEQGMTKKTATLVLATRTAVRTNVWIEAFWCPECEAVTWYLVERNSDRSFKVSPVPRGLWERMEGAIDPFGNPTVSEFTRKQAKRLTDRLYKDYNN
ncbi:hypothetical protein FRE64_14365 [Euhalothece natronophila Z-M001]|uniref:Uncharacterized protein n=1 Tax=Euhalothece natronophila Z-M001 TaxID=522448 RepID=A0A5B8NT46_9CHRO|nr:hypothetical protein FRE64_14365 [Euhalothece natronophila Z-M001]